MKLLAGRVHDPGRSEQGDLVLALTGCEFDVTDEQFSKLGEYLDMLGDHVVAPTRVTVQFVGGMTQHLFIGPSDMSDDRLRGAVTFSEIIPRMLDLDPVALCDVRDFVNSRLAPTADKLTAVGLQLAGGELQKAIQNILGVEAALRDARQEAGLPAPILLWPTTAIEMAIADDWGACPKCKIDLSEYEHDPSLPFHPILSISNEVFTATCPECDSLWNVYFATGKIEFEDGLDAEGLDDDSDDEAGGETDDYEDDE